LSCRWAATAAADKPLFLGFAMIRRFPDEAAQMHLVQILLPFTDTKGTSTKEIMIRCHKTEQL
jgi:hypothetical protein